MSPQQASESGSPASAAESTANAATVAAANDVTAHAPASSAAAGSLDDPLRILVVDDVKSNRMMLRRLLLRQLPGCVVHEAEDGLEALAAVMKSQEPQQQDVAEAAGSSGTTSAVGAAPQAYDILLIDGSMPNCDGYTATRRLRQELGYQGLIIGVTGNALSDDQSAFLSAGADAVHIKPVASDVLIRDIRQWVDSRRSAHAAGVQLDGQGPG